MRIFGIGAHKTGTTSLARALAMLGFPASHWIHHRELLRAISRGNFRFDLLRGYRAALDLPIPTVFRELDAAFPGSRFILTLREPARWLRSLRTREEWHGMRDPIPLHPAEAHFYGFDTFDPARCLARVEEHNAAVRAHFADRPAQLLELDIAAGDGWETLCPFLGVPAPDVPFPHENSASRVWPYQRLLARVGFAPRAVDRWLRGGLAWALKAGAR